MEGENAQAKNAQANCEWRSSCRIFDRAFRDSERSSNDGPPYRPSSRPRSLKQIRLKRLHMFVAGHGNAGPMAAGGASGVGIMALVTVMVMADNHITDGGGTPGTVARRIGQSRTGSASLVVATEDRSLTPPFARPGYFRDGLLMSATALADIAATLFEPHAL
jgi:hypothetical protein